MTRRPLFPPPALAPRPHCPRPGLPLGAEVVGSFKMDRAAPVAEVAVTVGPVRFVCLTRGGRVVGPTHRGEPAVRLTDRALALDVYRLVVEAATRADARGWGP